MAIGAGLTGITDLAAPKRLAVEHSERRGIGRVVILHRAGRRAHRVVARAALIERDFGSREGRDGEKKQAGHSGRAERGLESMPTTRADFVPAVVMDSG